MKFKLLLLSLLLTVLSQAQKKRCGTDELNLLRLQQNPTLIETRKVQEEKLQQSLLHYSKKRLNLTIPVVVHVLYNADNENISDEQIYSQIVALNEDYNNLNNDTLKTDHPFYPLVGKVGIKFELAKKDPNGKPTTGITRTKTPKISWGDNDLNYDNIKFSSDGGVDNWDPNNYLNIYSVRFADSVQLLGYAFFPEDLASNSSNDGVVIDFRCFGTTGVAGSEGFDAYKLGRTVTHEVGHWLGLRHIWGDLVYDTDKKCGDDLVTDTPPAESDNSGEPTFPYRPNNHCGSDANGEMYMNYMDYVHDKAMVMFSKGQANRMISSIQNYRSSLLKYVVPTLVTSLTIKTPNNDTVFNQSIDTLQLSVQILPVDATNKKVTWSVSPDSLAQINQSGRVVLLKDGVINVTATANDGSGVSSTKKITINKAPVLPILVSSINILTPNNDSVFTLSLQSIHLNAGVLPVDATNKLVTWSVSPDSIATIDQFGVVTFLKEGIITVTASSKDSSSIQSTKQLTIKKSLATLVNSGDLNLMKIVPNPSSETIEILNFKMSNAYLKIYDVIGQLCFQSSYSDNQGKIDISSLERGNYIIELSSSNDDVVYRSKFIKD